MGSPGLIMSGSKDEGVLLGNVKAQAQPPGRGFLVERRVGSRLIQVALVDEAAAAAAVPAPAAGNGSELDAPATGRVASHRRP